MVKTKLKLDLECRGVAANPVRGKEDKKTLHKKWNKEVIMVRIEEEKVKQKQKNLREQIL